MNWTKVAGWSNPTWHPGEHDGGKPMMATAAADLFWTSWERAGIDVVSAVGIVVVVIATIRISGLRSLSKMSSFDFAVTVAIGSIIATVAASSTSLADGGIAVVSLLAFQALIARLRRTMSFQSVVDNEPLLLARHGVICEAALSSSRVTRSDVTAKLREANVTAMDQVLAVVLETTGDISVLHGDGPLEERLLDGVRNRDWVPSRD